MKNSSPIQIVSGAVAVVLGVCVHLPVLIVLAACASPIYADEFISSERLIEKLDRPPPRRTRGLVKTPGPDIGYGTSATGGPAVATGSVMLKIRFARDSSELSPASLQQLNELGIALNSPQLVSYAFEIAGHTDAVGDRMYNKELSIRRANAVKQYLSMRLGVSQQRLHAVGMGEDKPIIPSDPFNPDNRRVEIINLGH
jgi:outer membrane protein OmpA-like peptidoglycan-associated protein